MVLSQSLSHFDDFVNPLLKWFRVCISCRTTYLTMYNVNICVGDKIISPSIVLTQSQKQIINLSEPILRNVCNLGDNSDTIVWCIKIMKQNSNVKGKSMQIIDDNYVLFDGKNFTNNLTLSTWYGGETSVFSRVNISSSTGIMISSIQNDIRRYFQIDIIKVMAFKWN